MSSIDQETPCVAIPSDNAESTMLNQAISDYLLWLVSNGCSQKTCQGYEKELNQFTLFISHGNIAWDKIFTVATLKAFQEYRNLKYVPAVRGIARYLFQHKRIKQPIQKQSDPLPQIYEQYLLYYQQSRQLPDRQIRHTRRILLSLHGYLHGHKVDPPSLSIEHVDAFTAEFSKGLALTTCKCYRSQLRGFLKYLYHERNILRKDLAPLLVGAPLFARAKPPKFLRPHEVQGLFANLKLSTPADLRTYAMVHLGYALGLRPVEISRITLDDISFTKGELCLRHRKGKKPMTAPVPEDTMKAIAAYVLRVRVKSQCRTLFLSLRPPYRPASAASVARCITKAMKEAGLSSSAYWLRHTYAQNLLESGATIYELKEMLGHDTILATQRYLHVHIKLMREVLFDETL